MAKKDIIEHQFKEGQSGNPNGRPKGVKNLSSILKEFLSEPVEVNIDGIKTKKEFQEVLIRKLLKLANDGDMRAINTIFDRVEGKAKEHHVIENINPANSSLVIEVIDDDEINKDEN